MRWVVRWQCPFRFPSMEGLDSVRFATDPREGQAHADARRVRDRAIFIERYGSSPRRVKEIATAHGLTPARVYQILWAQRTKACRAVGSGSLVGRGQARDRLIAQLEAVPEGEEQQYNKILARALEDLDTEGERL